MKTKTLLFALLLGALSACNNCADTCEFGECVDNDCELWKNAFVGVYVGNSTCNGNQQPDNGTITAGASDNALVIDGIIQAEVTSARSFTIPAQTVVYQGQSMTIQGAGTLDGGTLTMSTTASIGSQSNTCIFSGS